jgi:hypothetical protein
MTRRSYVQIDGVLYEKGTEPRRSTEEAQRGPAIFGDLPDFVSPIDGRSYSGRRGLREHCDRHSVVPNADLKGLPVLTTNSETRSQQEIRRDKAARKEQVIRLVNQHYR